jgi:hypothetical protein
MIPNIYVPFWLWSASNSVAKGSVPRIGTGLRCRGPYFREILTKVSDELIARLL